MTDPHGGIGDVSMLSARTGTPVKLNLQIGFLYLDSHACLMDHILLVDMQLRTYKYTRNINRGKPMNAIALLEKYFPDRSAFRIILEHSRLVATKALQTARSLDQPEVDLKFLEEASLLHDIGVCRTASPRFHCHGTEPYIRHGIIGREILEVEGFPRHALVCERHIGVGLSVSDIRSQRLPLPEEEMTPLSLEEKIVCFADLFYSKSQEKRRQEKTINEIKTALEKYGEQKVMIFEGWLKDFKFV
jgi:uncharacterized protein